MSFPEAIEYIKGAELKKQDEWEQTRLLMYVVCQVNSRKKIDPEDIMRLPWDEQKKEDSKEDIEALRERAKKFKID